MELSNYSTEKSCKDTCLLCDNPSIVYVNYARYHGVCEAHLDSYLSIVQCKNCISLVKFIIKNPVSCDICSRNSPVHSQPCSHNICDPCLTLYKKCIKCNP